MSNKINDNWKLRITFNSFRRYLTQEITEYNIAHLKIELNYAISQLNKLEVELKNI